MDPETRDFYNKIAESWYNVRHWTIVEKELKQMNERWSRGKILNIGCAHGPDFLPFDSSKFDFFGVDISENLLKLAQKYYKKFKIKFNLSLADACKLPFRNSSFDYIVSVAAIHHILDKIQRIEALREMKRVLKKEAFVSVWNRKNPELPDKEVIEREWKHKNRILKRPYFMYTESGFEKELKEAGFNVKKIETDERERNIFAIISPTKRPS